jgi:AcrR family transcriptional regulator
MLIEPPTSDMPTKQRILSCAVNLFCEKGYSETAIRDIASAVGIKASSIYNHFPSKEALLMFMLNDYEK